MQPLVFHHLGHGCPVRRGIAALGSGRCTSWAGAATIGMGLHKCTACTHTYHISTLVESPKSGLLCYAPALCSFDEVLC